MTLTRDMVVTCSEEARREEEAKARREEEVTASEVSQAKRGAPAKEVSHTPGRRTRTDPRAPIRARGRSRADIGFRKAAKKADGTPRSFCGGAKVRRTEKNKQEGSRWRGAESAADVAKQASHAHARHEASARARAHIERAWRRYAAKNCSRGRGRGRVGRPTGSVVCQTRGRWFGRDRYGVEYARLGWRLRQARVRVPPRRCRNPRTHPPTGVRTAPRSSAFPRTPLPPAVIVIVASPSLRAEARPNPPAAAASS